MQIGDQIKALRQRRNITQEAMAQHFGITPQAISKWERGVTTPDIALLPRLSAYFGVTIDELFSLSDEMRMDRIQNMLWDIRFLEPSVVENERKFLLEKARRQPDDPAPLRMLAQLELHLAQEHNTRAAEYAKKLIACEPDAPYAGFMYLSMAMGGRHYDPRFNLKNELVNIYKAHIEKYPECVDPYQWLIGQLIADHRLKEAEDYVERLAKFEKSYVLTVQRIKLALARRDFDAARALWTQMGAENPDDFTVWQWIGDFQTQAGAHKQARESYQRSISLLETPRFLDPVIALALLCEMDGDIPGAIEANELALKITQQEWNDTTGESVDELKRELARLKALL